MAALGRLPGIGPRSAERIALFVAHAEPDLAAQLAHALVDARAKVRACDVCGSLTEVSPCRLCTSPDRDGSTLCVVERATDVLALEKSGTFRGRYHVLGGRLSPVNGIGPDDLRVAELERRLRGPSSPGSAEPPVVEVILALGTDVEGDATAHYLAERLTAAGAQVTRLAAGLPAGTGLDFADELTLSRALEGRRPLKS